MAEAYVNINITNMDVAKEKAAELVETLNKAKDIISLEYSQYFGHEK